MKAVFIAIAAAFVLAGCSIHSKEQLAAVRAAGVSPRTYAKLNENAPISPEDVIELRRHRVSDSVPIYHLDRIGVDYVVQKDDLKAMRAANVSPDVVSAVNDASRRFAYGHYARRSWYWGYDYWDPYPYFWPGLTLGYGWGGGYYHHDWHDHHDGHDHHDWHHHH